MDYAADGQLRKVSAEKAWATIEELARYKDEGWNDPEAFEDLVMNFILDQEERVKQLEEYMGVIGNDFMQLCLEVIRRSKEEIRLENNRIKKIEKITRLGGEPRKIPLLEFGWRVRLYYEKQFRIANSFGLLTNLMVDALSVEPRAHVREEDEVEEVANEEAGGSAKYLSTRENLDPHLQIDPFPGREADYPPYGYTNHMPPGYEYQFGPTPPGGFD
ncbi:hypothetical protein Tco_1530821 [Tanacetum coccineum]